MEATKFKTVQEYLSAQPAPVKAMLQQMRSTIKEAAPGAEEVISYNMPAFKLQGMLVWYAAFKNHIGFYPAPMGIDEFKDETAIYRTGKGTLQFPLDQPIPYDLITKIVKFRVQRNLEKRKKS